MFDRLTFFGKDLSKLDWENVKIFLQDNKDAVLAVSKDKILLFINSSVVNVRKSIYESFFKHTEMRRVATLIEETDTFYKFKLRSPDLVALYEASLVAYLLNALTPVNALTPEQDVQTEEQKSEQKPIKKPKKETKSKKQPKIEEQKPNAAKKSEEQKAKDKKAKIAKPVA